MNQIIVIGGGLSGLSAAHTVMEQGVKVVLCSDDPDMWGEGKGTCLHRECKRALQAGLTRKELP